MKEFCYLIIAGIFTIIGAIIGGTIAYWSALKTIKLQEFNKAASEFHVSFIEAQRRLGESLNEYTSKEHETSPLIDTKHEDKIRILVLSRIDKILSFAEIKNT